MRLETLDGPTRERVLGYVREVGGVATHATGGVLRVTMPSWQAVVELATWIGLDAAEWSTEIVDLALRLATPAACLVWVQSHIEWRDEPGERLAYPTITIDRGAGDCDDTASLLVALLTAIGYPAVVCACTIDGIPVHGVAAVQLASGWHWADGSEPRDLRPWREHPLASDARRGARGVITPAPSMLRWPVLSWRMATITGEAVPTTTVSLRPGGWYAAAIDTGIVPASLALDTIEERLRSALQIGSLRFFTSRDDVPGEVPAVVRDADADVWVTGQYVGQTTITAPRPEQVIAFESLPTTTGGVVGPPVRPGPGPVAPPGPRPLPPTGTAAETTTSTLIWVGLGVVVVGGGVIALTWYLRRPQKNPRRRRRRRR